VIMRLSLAVVAITFILSLPSPQLQTKPQEPQQATATDKRGTQESPFVVKTVPATEETAQEKLDRDNKAQNDRNLVKFSGVLALVAILQLIVYAYQSRQLSKTVKAAGEQSEAMERHIGEAARSANAMENIAATIESGNRAILRAYITVTIGALSLFQQRREPGQPDLKFETRPNLINTGNTGARNVNITIAADILPVPLPKDFQYPLPEENEIKDAGAVGAHQTYVIAGTVKDFVPDWEVATIKEGRTKALYVWGLITYDDVFGERHNTKFAQWITWNPNGVVAGYYIAGQNDSD
jgi:hypothetical protein